MMAKMAEQNYLTCAVLVESIMGNITVKVFRTYKVPVVKEETSFKTVYERRTKTDHNRLLEST